MLIAVHKSMDTEQVSALLRANGITPTPQRTMIASYLFSQPQHLSAEQILCEVNSQDLSVSKATVYNTLGLFRERGLVREVLIDPGRVFYDSNMSPHYHIYHIDTGSLEDIPTESVPITQLPALPDGCTLDSLEIVIKVRGSAS